VVRADADQRQPPSACQRPNSRPHVQIGAHNRLQTRLFTIVRADPNGGKINYQPFNCSKTGVIELFQLVSAEISSKSSHNAGPLNGSPLSVPGRPHPIVVTRYSARPKATELVPNVPLAKGAAPAERPPESPGEDLSLLPHPLEAGGSRMSEAIQNVLGKSSSDALASQSAPKSLYTGHAPEQAVWWLIFGYSPNALSHAVAKQKK